MVQVRQVFRISKIGTVAGCYVQEGLVKRSAQVRVLRDNVVIHTGEIDSLKRFKDDVREVKAGFECGMSLKNFADLKEGDQFEVFETVEVARTLVKKGHGSPAEAGRPDPAGALAISSRCELRDPRVGMITHHLGRRFARFVARQGLLHDARARKSWRTRWRGCKRSAGFLRSQLAKRIKMYTTPELRFVYDESVERGDHLSRLIDSAPSRMPKR